MKEKKYQRPLRQRQAEKRFRLIQLIILLAGLASLLFVKPVYALIAPGLCIWNAWFYCEGCQEQVVDEYEQDGYPTIGLRRMYESWKELAICAAIILLIVYFAH